MIHNIVFVGVFVIVIVGFGFFCCRYYNEIRDSYYNVDLEENLL